MKNDHYIKVPMEVAASYDLTWQEKFIYAEILYRHQLKDGCTAKQKTIGAKYNIGPDVCSRILKKLEIKNFINRSEGCITPLKFVDQKSSKVDQKSTKDANAKLTKSQHKVDQKSTELDQKSTAHLLINNKLKIKGEIKEEIPALENLSLNSEKEKRKKKKSEAAKKEKEPQFGGGVPISLRLYECLLKKDANKFPSKPMQQHFKDLKSIIQTLKDFIKDEKKQRGEPYFNVTDNDILETWQVLLDNLSPRIIEKYFNTSSLARNLSSYLYEVKTGTHKTSGSGISQDFKDKLDNFLQENNI